MSLLPANEPKVKDITPKTFLIWGESMSGKTYLAKQFPNPIILNTDGNAKKIDTPSVEIKDFETFIKVVSELETTKHTYETLIIDLIDDIETMLINMICKSAGVEALADIGFGKGFAKFNSVWKNLMMRLSQLPIKVIFISHIVKLTDENDKTYEAPSLPQKSLNACQGRCDLVIQTKKLGTKYVSTVSAKREAYVQTDFKDKKILEILKNVILLFPQQAPVRTVPTGTTNTAPNTVAQATSTIAQNIATGTATNIATQNTNKIGGTK